MSAFANTKDISQLDFVAFDTETTGLYPASEALVEIAAVRFNLVYGVLEYFQTLVNPGKPIPLQATRVHGITDEMVFTAPPTSAVLPQFFFLYCGRRTCGAPRSL
jgi:DNA polymerase-3 subunit epsilon